MKRALIAVKLLVAILVACAAPLQGTPQNDRPVEIPPTSAPLKASPTQPATKSSSAPTEKATAAPTPAAQYSDAPLESSVLLATWDRGQQAELRPIDPNTGWDLAGYAPIGLGQNFQHVFSPDGQTLAVTPYDGGIYCSGTPATCRAPGGLIRILDLQAWRATTTTIEVEDWISAMSFSPDGERLAIAYDGAHSGAEGQLTLVDVARQAVTAQASVSFIPRLLKYNRDGASLMLYGLEASLQDRSLNRPRAALFNAADLTLVWETRLPDILDGLIPKEGSATSEYEGILWEPATAFAPDGSALYIVHADAEKLTTVDFVERATRTVDIRPPQSWLDQLMALTAGVAHAKTWDWTRKQAVISLDGRWLYVVGETSTWSQNAQGEGQVIQTSLGLQVIEAATGTEIARRDSEATQISIAPGGTRLYLQGWTKRWTKWALYQEPWTEVRDAGSLEVIAHLTGQHVVPARQLDGQPILLSSYMRGDEQTDLTALDAESLDEIYAWSVKGVAGWLAAP